MITRLEVRNFRMLRGNSIALPSFAALVGKNATGKSTFLSVFRFLSDLLTGGVPLALSHALETDAPHFSELCFDSTSPIAFAVETTINGANDADSHLRYEIEIGPAVEGPVVVLRENLFIVPDAARELAGQKSLWGDDAFFTIHDKIPSGWRKIVSKTSEGKDYFRDERTDWNNIFRFGPERAALGAIPEDPNRFPKALKLRDLLREGVTFLELDGQKLRQPSSARSATRLLPDGSNLARVAAALRDRDPVLFDQWGRHVASAIDGLTQIEVWERPEDRKLVLQARFGGQHAEPVPAWLLSDGTLRLMALTLLSYAGSETAGLFLVEEPENGLHPQAMQAAYAALSQPPDDGQVLVATHSPVFLTHVKLSEALVFRRLKDGSARVTRGTEVEELKSWQKNASIADIFATGVLA